MARRTGELGRKVERRLVLPRNHSNVSDMLHCRMHGRMYGNNASGSYFQTVLSWHLACAHTGKWQLQSRTHSWTSHASHRT